MDVTSYFQSPEKGDAGLSALARGVVGSEILRIAGEIRAMHAKGLPVCNLTVGDFDPKYFPIPTELLDGTRKALESGQTNYPPAEGILALREALGDRGLFCWGHDLDLLQHAERTAQRQLRAEDVSDMETIA